MKLPLAPIPALLCTVVFQAPAALAALPDHGLLSAAGATGQTIHSTGDATLVHVQWPSYSASAQTDYRINRAQSASATSDTLAYAGSLWWDRYTISGSSGTGSANFTALLGGDLQAVGVAGAGVGYLLVISDTLPAEFDFDFSGFTAANASDWLNAQLDANQPGGATVLVKYVDTVSGMANKTIDQTFMGSLNFTYDTPFYVGAVLLTGVGVGSGGAARADFFDTAMLSVTLAPGDTLLVASVPEPGEWAMLFAGLVLIALRMHRRTAVRVRSGT